jgi:hypothetical protein
VFTPAMVEQWLDVIARTCLFGSTGTTVGQWRAVMP